MKLCLVDMCEEPHRAFGYCERHYRRYKRNGTPSPVSVVPTNEGKPLTPEFINDLRKTLREVR